MGMFTITESFQKSSKELAVEKMLLDVEASYKDYCNSSFSELGIFDYKYSSKEAKDALGLEEELIYELIDDYVNQIIRSVPKFLEYIQKLENDKSLGKELDYSELRDLTHKNLGVAHNLRIRNAEILLREIMIKDDLKYLKSSVKCLELYAVKLAPDCAYKTYNLMKIKTIFLKS